ncbi:MAG TPA: YgjP-like metallopeptidase domain-containing protein [Sulfuricurvum sp.]|nr:YgjP-like metallopeptidase domain-containing protein [Sulfuricurvum sp.]
MLFDPLHSSFIHVHVPTNKNTYISLTKEGAVRVRTPLKDEQRVRRLLIQRADWINAKLSIIHEAPPTHTLGETILFRGEIIPVQQLPQLHKSLEKSRKSIDIKKYYTRFYHNESLLTLPSRIRHYAQKMNLSPSEIRYKNMRRRWGSCDSNGVITFNVMMMQLSYRHVDYIIVHELAHMRHMNHSKAFHDLVRTILEDEKLLRQELKTIRMH